MRNETRLFYFFFFSGILCRGMDLRNWVSHLNLQIDKSEIRIILNFTKIKYNENKYFEICRIIVRVFSFQRYSSQLFHRVIMKRDQHCAPRANPFVNAQTKFLIRAVDQVKMYSTSFRVALFCITTDISLCLSRATSFRLITVNFEIKRVLLSAI